MKAIVYTQHGLPIEDPQSLHEQNLPEPAPGLRDLRVKVRAIAVNPVDMIVYCADACTTRIARSRALACERLFHSNRAGWGDLHLPCGQGPTANCAHP